MANHLVLWAASALLPLAVHAQSGKEPVAPREPTKPLTSSARDKASEICT